MWTKYAVKAALTVGMVGLRLVQIAVVYCLLDHTRRMLSQRRNSVKAGT